MLRPHADIEASYRHRGSYTLEELDAEGARQ